MGQTWATVWTTSFNPVLLTPCFSLLDSAKQCLLARDPIGAVGGRKRFEHHTTLKNRGSDLVPGDLSTVHSSVEEVKLIKASRQILIFGIAALLRSDTAWRCFPFVDFQLLLTPFNSLVLVGEGLVNRLTPDHGHSPKAIEVFPDAFRQVVVGHASFKISSCKRDLVILKGALTLYPSRVSPSGLDHLDTGAE